MSPNINSVLKSKLIIKQHFPVQPLLEAAHMAIRVLIPLPPAARGTEAIKSTGSYFSFIYSHAAYKSMLYLFINRCVATSAATGVVCKIPDVLNTVLTVSLALVACFLLLFFFFLPVQ